MINEFELAAVEFNIRILLNKVMNLRCENTQSKKISLNCKKISLMIEDIDNELTSARAKQRNPLIISNKKIRRRNHATA